MMRPSLDYYIGRAVEKVKESPDGWDIHLEGGVSVTNLDGRRKMPDEIKNLTFLGWNFGNDRVSLDFGQVFAGRPPRIEATIDLTVGNFRINDSRFADLEETPTAQDSLPDDPSEERAVEEPQTPEIELVEVEENVEGFRILPPDHPSTGGMGSGNF